MEFLVPALSFRKPYASGGLASISDRASSPPVDTGEGWRGLRFESARAYHSFQYFREFSSESERNFTCNSSPVRGVLGTVGVGLVQLTPNTHPKIASPLLAVEFRLFRKIPTSGLPTFRELACTPQTSSAIVPYLMLLESVSALTYSGKVFAKPITYLLNSFFATNALLLASNWFTVVP